MGIEIKDFGEYFLELLYTGDRVTVPRFSRQEAVIEWLGASVAGIGNGITLESEPCNLGRDCGHVVLWLSSPVLGYSADGKPLIAKGR